MKTTSKPLLHPNDLSVIDSYLSSPKQSLLVQGEAGSHYALVSAWLSEELADNQSIPPEHVRTVEKADKASMISIDQVNNILSAIKYKNQQNQGFIVVIQNADLLSAEAQNRLLKTLEEPSNNTYFVLTSSNIDRILPTIRSRTSHIKLANPTKAQVLKHFSGSHSTEDISKAYSIGRGAFGLIEAHLNSSSNEAVDIAKQIVSSKHFERLKVTEKLSKDRVLATQVLEVMLQMFNALIRVAVAKKQADQVNKYVDKLEVTEEVLSSLNKNVNIKLALDYLFLKV